MGQEDWWGKIKNKISNGPILPYKNTLSSPFLKIFETGDSASSRPYSIFLKIQTNVIFDEFGGQIVGAS